MIQCVQLYLVWYVIVAKVVWFRFSILFNWIHLPCLSLLWMSEAMTGFTGQLVMDILTVVASKTDCKTSNNAPFTNSSSSENGFIWIRTTCLSEDAIYPILKRWWNGRGSRDILRLEETKMGVQLQHSSKWTHSISCQAINIEESSVFSFVTSWLIVSSDILTWRMPHKWWHFILGL